MNLDFDIKVNENHSKVELIKENGNILTVMVNGKKYEIDIISVGDCIYSILYKNKSYNVELIEGENGKKFTVNTLYQTFNIEIIDAESRYLTNRNKSKELEGNNIISSPMPGRIVHIPVSVNQQ